VFEAVRDARAEPARAPALAAAVRECCEEAFGLCLRGEEEEAGDDVLDLVAQRDAARAGRDWAAADTIRAQLQAMGFVVEDGSQGTVVRRER